MTPLTDPLYNEAHARAYAAEVLGHRRVLRDENTSADQVLEAAQNHVARMCADALAMSDNPAAARAYAHAYRLLHTSLMRLRDRHHGTHFAEIFRPTPKETRR